MAIESDRLRRVNLPTIASELLVAQGVLNRQDSDQEGSWEPHFHPKIYAKEHPRMKIAEHVMD